MGMHADVLTLGLPSRKLVTEKSMTYGVTNRPTLDLRLLASMFVVDTVDSRDTVQEKMLLDQFGCIESKNKFT